MPSPLPPTPARPGTRALATALARIGDRWSLLIVDALMEGAKRFADLEPAVTGISTNILTSRLRRLEAEGVVLAVPYSERPRRFAYELTAAGRDLAGAVRLLSQWSADHAGPGAGDATGDTSDLAGFDARSGDGTPAHDRCGTPMVAVWWCPTCEQPGGGDGAEAEWV